MAPERVLTHPPEDVVLPTVPTPEHEASATENAVFAAPADLATPTVPEPTPPPATTLKIESFLRAKTEDVVGSNLSVSPAPPIVRGGYPRRRSKSALAKTPPDNVSTPKTIAPLAPPKAEPAPPPAPKTPKTNQNKLTADEVNVTVWEATRNTVGVYLRGIGKYPLLDGREEEVLLAKKIEAGLYAAHKLSQSAQYPTPIRRNLDAIVREGEQAKKQFTQANLRWVVTLAKNKTGKGLGLLDLIQEGNLGLMHAVEKFDYTKGYKFSTYSKYWILQAMSRAIHKKGRAIRIANGTAEIMDRVLGCRSDLAETLGRSPTAEELSTYHNKQNTRKEDQLTPEKVEEYLQFERQEPVSYDTAPREDDKYFNDGNVREAYIRDTAPTPEQHVTGRTSVHEALQTADLTEREQKILDLRFGLSGGEPLENEEIAKRLWLTGAMLQRILHDLLLKLRQDPELARHMTLGKDRP